MASPAQIAWLVSMKASATLAKHPWPAAAACEAVVETGWGSHIPQGSHNVLGIKAYAGWHGPTVDANGTEQHKDGTWTGPENDRWCVFVSYAACFAEQMKILAEPRYAEARAATDIAGYIAAECRVWSTGLDKGKAVFETYLAHMSVL